MNRNSRHERSGENDNDCVESERGENNSSSSNWTRSGLSSSMDHISHLSTLKLNTLERDSFITGAAWALLSNWQFEKWDWDWDWNWNTCIKYEIVIAHTKRIKADRPGSDQRHKSIAKLKHPPNPTRYRVELDWLDPIQLDCLPGEMRWDVISSLSLFNDLMNGELVAQADIQHQFTSISHSHWHPHSHSTTNDNERRAFVNKQKESTRRNRIHLIQKLSLENLLRETWSNHPISFEPVSCVKNKK